MKGFEKTRAQRDVLKEEYLSHQPTTDILDRIKAATPTRGIITNVLITPEIARDLLTLNRENRPPDFTVIRKYAEFMQADRWIYIGDIIRITKDLRLVDAQQRLLAIIETGSTIEMHIQTGLSDESFGVIDSGRTRTGADALAIAGFKDVNVLSAAIRADIYFRTQRRVGARINVKRVYPLQVIEWTEKQDLKLMQDRVEYSIRYLHVKGKFLAQSTWAFVYYTLSTIRGAKTQATNFVTLLASGENVSLQDETSVIYLLREKLMDIRKEKSLGGKTETDLKVRYIFTAWNLFRERQIIKKITIDTKALELPTPK
jgi:hypothetical protein